MFFLFSIIRNGNNAEFAQLEKMMTLTFAAHVAAVRNWHVKVIFVCCATSLMSSGSFSAEGRQAVPTLRSTNENEILLSWAFTLTS